MILETVYLIVVALTNMFG